MSKFVSLSLSLSLSLMTSGLAVAQDRDPNVIPRDIIGNGAYTGRVWEPTVAVGGNFAVSVFFAETFGVKYAVYNLNSEAWVFEGSTDDEMPGLHDPSIAYNSFSGEFVACARNGVAIWTNVFTPSSDPNDPAGQWAGWVSQISESTPSVFDKPWIIAGEMTEEVQEFYIVMHVPLGYLRTITGGHGQEWAYSEMYLHNDPGDDLVGGFAFPAVWQDGEFYTGYIDTSGVSPTFRLLVGQDIDPNDPNDFDPTDPAEVGIIFTEMQKLCGLELLDDPISIAFDLNQITFADEIPGGFLAKSAPQVVADPTNADRLLVVYHDVEDSNSTDVNVYLHELTRDAGKWCASERILVNNDQLAGEQDQWGASATIDEYGYVHIIFYDDRAFAQDDSEEEPKYNVTYAWAPPGDLDFSDPLNNIDLFAVPTETAYDGTLNAFDPHEYNGIAFQGDLIFTVYAGTWASDFQTNKASIASSRVKWHAVP